MVEVCSTNTAAVTEVELQRLGLQQIAHAASRPGQKRLAQRQRGPRQRGPRRLQALGMLRERRREKRLHFVSNGRKNTRAAIILLSTDSLIPPLHSLYYYDGMLGSLRLCNDRHPQLHGTRLCGIHLLLHRPLLCRK